MRQTNEQHTSKKALVSYYLKQCLAIICVKAAWSDCCSQPSNHTAWAWIFWVKNMPWYHVACRHFSDIQECVCLCLWHSS